jgi:uncharacterized protein (TIGR00255 family)
MTGYGRGVAENGGRRVSVEIRSVNHRFLDLKIRGASLAPAVEDQVSGAVRKQLERGSVTVTVRLDRAGAGGSASIDRAVAARFYRELLELASELRIEQPISLELLCAQPGVVVAGDEGDADALGQVVVAALQPALATLLDMRETEGATLARDIDARLERLRELTAHIAEHARVAPAEAQRRLHDRISRLMAAAKVPVDEARIAQEVAVLADRLDVTEELVRLGSHIDQVRQVMGGSGAVGRRLDFLVQELGREFNTIGSKSQSADIAAAVVEAKAELERVREQVQNIE